MGKFKSKAELSKYFLDTPASAVSRLGISRACFWSWLCGDRNPGEGSLKKINANCEVRVTIQDIEQLVQARRGKLTYAHFVLYKKHFRRKALAELDVYREKLQRKLKVSELSLADALMVEIGICLV